MSSIFEQSDENGQSFPDEEVAKLLAKREISSLYTKPAPEAGFDQ
jgi:hypothetical protein